MSGLFWAGAAAAVPPLLDAAGRRGRAARLRPRVPEGRRPQRVLVLIPARAEGTRVLPLCRDVLREAGDAGVRADLLVILDGPDPASEAALWAEGVPFLVKTPAGPSKGKALAFATERLLSTQPDLLTAAQYVMVFDADMRLEEGFFSRLVVPGDADAFQLPVRPAGTPPAGPARVEALSLALATRVEDLARDAEELPVRLRGKAMGLSPRAFRDGPAAVHRTTVEDSEATLRLLSLGRRIRALPAPFAFDEAPGDPGALARPRARWLAGHAKLLFAGLPDLLRLAIGRPRGAFVLAADLWLRPRAFVLAFLLLLAAASDAALLLLSLRGGPVRTEILLPPLLGSLVSKAGLVLEGLVVLAGRARLGYPPEVPPVGPGDLAASLLVWLRAAGRAIVSPGAWHRARPAA